MKRLFFALLLFPACFPMEGPRSYPTWERVSQGTQVLADCADVDAWTIKSGKEGLGMIVELRGRSTTPCTVQLTAARLRVGEQEYATKHLPEPPRLRLGQRVNAYIAFAFDGDRAWNENSAAALILVTPKKTVTFPLKQKLPSREECENR